MILVFLLHRKRRYFLRLLELTFVKMSPEFEENDSKLNSNSKTFLSILTSNDIIHFMTSHFRGIFKKVMGNLTFYLFEKKIIQNDYRKKP